MIPVPLKINLSQYFTRRRKLKKKRVVCVVSCFDDTVLSHFYKGRTTPRVSWTRTVVGVGCSTTGLVPRCTVLGGFPTPLDLHDKSRTRTKGQCQRD